MDQGRDLGRSDIGVPGPCLSIVVPVYNEEESVPELVGQLSEIMNKLDGPAEAVLVDDGSKDSSYQLMLDAHDEIGRAHV